jgi:DNA-binding MarR family transcriptional regulator
MKSNYYLNFLNVLKAVNQGSVSEELDPTSKLVLEEIALGVANGQPLTVSDVMRLTSIASPATLHRKLDVLLDAQLIEATFQGHNRRTKFMMLTPQGKAYFSKLSDVLASIKPAF